MITVGIVRLCHKSGKVHRCKISAAEKDDILEIVRLYETRG